MFWSFSLTLYFKWEIRPTDGHSQGIFYQNQVTFFDFQEWAANVSTPTLLKVSVGSYPCYLFTNRS